MYILDTDHISLMESASTSALAQRLRFRLAALKPGERITTIIAFEEQMRGWMTFLARARSIAQQVGAYRRLKGVLERYCGISVLEFDEAA
jgi:tRNA(fMet)-specific endonuclease VapC